MQFPSDFIALGSKAGSAGGAGGSKRGDGGGGAGSSSGSSGGQENDSIEELCCLSFGLKNGSRIHFDSVTCLNNQLLNFFFVHSI